MGKNLKGVELPKGIRQNKNGKYTCRFVNRFGKRVTSTHTSLSSAKDWLKIERAKDDLMQNANGDNITFDMAFNMWMKYTVENRVKQSTINSYRNTYNADLKNNIGLCYVAKINNDEFIYELYKKLEKHPKTTLCIVKRIINSVIDYCVYKDFLDKNRIRYIAIKSKPTQERSILTTSQLELFLKYMEEKKKNSPYYSIFLVMLNTGLRVSEVAAITTDDVDFENNFIRINKQLCYYSKLNRKNTLDNFNFATTKTKKSNRIIPMNEITRRVLLNEINRNNDKDLSKLKKYGFDKLIFLKRTLTPISRIDVSGCLNSVTKNIRKIDSTFPNLTSHMFRHIFASQLYEEKIDLKTIQTYLGHEQLTTTMNVYINSKMPKEPINDYAKWFSMVYEDAINQK